MNFSKLFLMTALGMSLNNIACGMKQLEGDMNNIRITQYNEATTRELQILLSNNHFSSVLEEKAKRLLNAGADPNRQSNIGWTLLHMAACDGSKEVVEILLKGGVNQNLQDIDGYTPLHMAACFGYKKVVESMINFVKNGANNLKQLEYLCSRDKTFRNKCQIFLMINKRENEYYSILYGFLAIPKPLCYEILLQTWDPTQDITELVNAKNKHGKTALDLAREKGKEEVVKLLEPYEKVVEIIEQDEKKEANSFTSYCILN